MVISVSFPENSRKVAVEEPEAEEGNTFNNRTNAS